MGLWLHIPQSYVSLQNIMSSVARLCASSGDRHVQLRAIISQ